MEQCDKNILGLFANYLLQWAEEGGHRCGLIICGDRKDVMLAISRDVDYRTLVHTIASAMMQEEALLSACETAARYARRKLEERDGGKEEEV